MKRCVIFVFSGTGNTMRVASYYKEYFWPSYETEIITVPLQSKKQTDSEKKVFASEVFEQDDSTNDASSLITAADLVGFAYPIHALNAPELFIQFAKHLPAAVSMRKHAFIFESSGEGLHINDGSSDLLRSILVHKGFLVLSDRHFVMPYNMILRHCDALVKQMTVYARALARLTVRELAEGVCEKKHFHPANTVLSALLRIEWLYAKVQGPFMKVDEQKCIRCGACAAQCPVHNITMTKGKVRMGHSCALCVRCSFNCPADAISLGLLNGWKVNGAYNFERIMSDNDLPFPFISDKTKGGYRIYKKYYRELDELFARAGVKIEPMDFRP